MSNDAASEILRDAGLTPKKAPAWPTQPQARPKPRPYAGGRPGTPLTGADRARWDRFAAEVDAALSETPDGQAILARYR